MMYLLGVLIGLTAGVLSGLLGIGGGIIIIPSLIYLFGLSQHVAQGTTLAVMIPPIGLLAAYVYYKNGYVNIPVAIIICISFFIGGFFGAKIAVGIKEALLRRIFGVGLLCIAFHLILKP